MGFLIGQRRLSAFKIHTAWFLIRCPSAFRSRFSPIGNEPSIIQARSYGDGLIRKRRLLAGVEIQLDVVRLEKTIMGRRGRIGGRTHVSTAAVIVFSIGQFRMGGNFVRLYDLSLGGQWVPRGRSRYLERRSGNKSRRWAISIRQSGSEHRRLA